MKARLLHAVLLLVIITASSPAMGQGGGNGVPPCLAILGNLGNLVAGNGGFIPNIYECVGHEHGRAGGGGLGSPLFGLGYGLVAALLGNDAETDQAFDIVLAVVENPAPAPFTQNSDWIAQALTPQLWLQPMGLDSSHLTWQEFTRHTYEEVFPNQAPANAYFLDYNVTLNGEIAFAANAVQQGELMAGFDAFGQPASTFLVMGPEDASVPTALGDLQSFVGEAIIVPEPSSFALATLGIIALAAARWRRKR